MEARYEDLTGRRFGRLVCVECVDVNPQGNAVWLVRCDCGTEFEALAFNVKEGHTLSCGCIRRERMARLNAERKRAGEGGR